MLILYQLEINLIRLHPLSICIIRKRGSKEGHVCTRHQYYYENQINSTPEAAQHRNNVQEHKMFPAYYSREWGWVGGVGPIIDLTITISINHISQLTYAAWIRMFVVPY